MKIPQYRDPTSFGGRGGVAGKPLAERDRGRVTPSQPGDGEVFKACAAAQKAVLWQVQREAS